MGPGNELGHPVTVENAYDHIFGLVLMNDWSGEPYQIKYLIVFVTFGNYLI